MYDKIGGLAKSTRQQFNLFARNISMSKGVKSDGSNQKIMEEFLANFDNWSDAELASAMDWFAEVKENGRERLDDVRLLEIAMAAGRFAVRTESIPTILKRYLLIKLQQGKNSWDKSDAVATAVLPWQR